MKQIITISLILLALTLKAQAAVGAFEKGADQLNVIAKCQLLEASAELDLVVTISTGGIAGLTQVSIERHYQADAEMQTFIVQQKNGSFIGEGIRLTADFSQIMSNGGYYATLQVNQQGDSTFDKLSCFAVYQNPQVNYGY